LGLGLCHATAPSKAACTGALAICQQQSKIVPVGGVKVYQSGFEKRAFGPGFGCMD
jgi:hypothetical protein